MAHNRALTHLRARGRAERAHRALPEATAPITSEDLLLEAERSLALRNSLEALVETQRVAMLLYYWEGNDVQRVADLLDVPPATIRKRLSRGRERLRGSVHARFADVARRSAPTAAFIATLAATAPGTAKGAGLGVGVGLVAVAVVILGLAGTMALPQAGASHQGPPTQTPAQTTVQAAVAPPSDESRDDPAPAYHYEAMAAWSNALGLPYFGCDVDRLPAGVELHGIVHEGAVWPYRVGANTMYMPTDVPKQFLKLQAPTPDADGAVTCRLETHTLPDAPVQPKPRSERATQGVFYAVTWGVGREVASDLSAEQRERTAAAKALSRDPALSPQARAILARHGSVDQADFDQRMTEGFPPPESIWMRGVGRAAGWAHRLREAWNASP